ncbi:hypothetical protein [Oharaeibacter diazotrophicus]|uniref:Uncharacterized protein n=1 Tax=Oharaeibacter diazotrophicus TaxID=1920512 RepID=A0A4R6RKT1_9HYPH|nr:hypothetical protein [Oharaeibacter diazotrophicus]TDP86705.1 hypothetical protein EDD54_0585 [Oharaeibacter diazotrophicus]BBE71353.1 hypothetical protein OHA_1_00926 [Pleomorphomonas sp. SM30]GLS78108.1 hypothetical protein GCM10007904_34450 [Oharaeibacter diazotrophicus]
MKIAEMLPGLDAEALATVRVNAVRLITRGTPKQKEQANAALDLIDREVARREAEAPPAAPKAKRARKTPVAS